ncbi:DUF6228 family protein [Streptomyces venezuelae]|uniref:DUF6228 family protein n=1 Tax=Streptomyces venezuelae TaxID=54571 RepID=UPI0037D08F94
MVAWTWDTDLTTFLEELAAGYRGWDGERTWHTMDRALTVSAGFRAGGYVSSRTPSCPAQRALKRDIIARLHAQVWGTTGVRSRTSSRSLGRP